MLNNRIAWSRKRLKLFLNGYLKSWKADKHLQTDAEASVTSATHIIAF